MSKITSRLKHWNVWSTKTWQWRRHHDYGVIPLLLHSCTVTTASGIFSSVSEPVRRDLWWRCIGREDGVPVAARPPRSARRLPPSSETHPRRQTDAQLSRKHLRSHRWEAPPPPPTHTAPGTGAFTQSVWFKEKKGRNAPFSAPCLFCHYLHRVPGRATLPGCSTSSAEPGIPPSSLRAGNKKQKSNLQGFSSSSWQKLTTTNIPSNPCLQGSNCNFQQSSKRFLTIHGADSEVKSCERRGQLVRLSRLLQKLQNGVLFLGLCGCNVPQRRPLTLTRLVQLKQGKEQPFHFAELMVTTATINRDVTSRRRSPPCEESWQPLAPPGPPRVAGVERTSCGAAERRAGGNVYWATPFLPKERNGMNK